MKVTKKDAADFAWDAAGAGVVLGVSLPLAARYGIRQPERIFTLRTVTFGAFCVLAVGLGQYGIDQLRAEMGWL